MNTIFIVFRILFLNKNFVQLAPRIPLEKIIEFLDMNPNLIALTQPFTESGYESMYIWSEDEKK